MNVGDLNTAIAALAAAGRALRTGFSSIYEEMRLADECYRVAALLKNVIEKECPEISIEREPCHATEP